MTLPDRPSERPQPDETGAEAGLLRLPVIKLRADFLAAARARRQPADGFLLQARDRGDHDGARVGYTCSKKIGNAVTRNRAKRRLRAIAAQILPGLARPGWDYVLIGRPDMTVSRDFAALRADLVRAMGRIHGPRP